MGHSLGDAIIVTAIAAAIVAYLYFKHLARQQRLEIIHKERLVAMEKDVPLLRVHHALASFRGDAKFGTWIYRIAFNQALNVKARVRFRAPHVSDAALSATASQDRGPDDRLQDQRRQRAVLACVSELPEVYQSALRLHYWLGASMSEIAVMLDTPENTVKSYLHRARRLLHAMLTARGFNAP